MIGWKRRACGLALVLLCGLAGCRTRAETAPPVTQGFVCEARVLCGDLRLTAQVARPTAGVCRLELKEPEALRGLAFELGGAGTRLRYAGLELELSSGDLPDTGFAQALLNALDGAARDGGLKREESASGPVYRGQSDSGEFLLAAAPDGSLERLQLPQLGLTFEFRDFQAG